MKRWRRIANMVFGVIGAFLVTSVFAPEVLAFPHHRTIGETAVYSDTPLPANLPQVLARSDALLHASAIYGPGYARRIFLTDGGWRWHLLALQTSDAFALTRALSGAMLVNRSDVANDRVFSRATGSRSRTLSGVIAHERTHGLIRARYGVFSDILYPAWVREGYCDLVAGGGTLSDGEAAALDARHESDPALLYYHGRKRVQAVLRANGGSVDALFAGAAAAP